MGRDFFIPGEAMVSVKSRSDSAIGSLTQLGLASEQIRVSPRFYHLDIDVNAWGGGQAPADVQWMIADAHVTMQLVNVDMTVLRECLRLSMGGAPSYGQLGRAGTRMGAGLTRFASGNNYIGLNIAAPVGLIPWCFYYAYLTDNPAEFPIGVERSIITLNWRCVPYTTDPWGGGTGTQGSVLWSNVLDT